VTSDPWKIGLSFFLSPLQVRWISDLLELEPSFLLEAVFRLARVPLPRFSHPSFEAPTARFFVFLFDTFIFFMLPS